MEYVEGGGVEAVSKIKKIIYHYLYAILYRIRIKSTYKILTSRHWKYRSDFKDEIDYIKRKESFLYNLKCKGS